MIRTIWVTNYIAVQGKLVCRNGEWGTVDVFGKLYMGKLC